MTPKTKKSIDDYYSGNISSQKLISYISKFESLSNEEIYKLYHNISNICNHCNSEMNYTGFKNGYRCTRECSYSRKLKPYKELERLSKDLILKNITKQNYISKKFLNEYNISSKECYDIVYPSTIKNCKYCSNETAFNSWSKGYKTVCNSIECKRKQRKERTELTNLKRYGVKNISELQEIKDRKLASSINTNLERYGVENVFQSKEIMYRNGVHASNTKEANRKRTETLFKRYGTTDLWSINNTRELGLYKCHNDENVKKKRINTCQERYGGPTPFHSKDFQNHLMSIKDTIGEDGLTVHQRIHINKINNIDENGLNSYERVHEMRLNNIDNNDLNSYERARTKQRETNELNGNWIIEDRVNDFKSYSRLVWRYTANQNLESLENFDKRGHANKGKYHLDHKFSIYEGFIKGIPAKIIGNIVNLEMIIGRNNISKGKKCSISLDELIERFENSEVNYEK